MRSLYSGDAGEETVAAFALLIGLALSRDMPIEGKVLLGRAAMHVSRELASAVEFVDDLEFAN